MQEQKIGSNSPHSVLRAARAAILIMVNSGSIKKKKQPKTKALVIARGVDIFRLLFDTRDDHRPDGQNNVRLAKVVLPLVNHALIDGENKEKAKRKEGTLAEYAFTSSSHQLTQPQVGSIVAINKQRSGGDHYDWHFFQITNITETGRIIARQLEKEGVPYHPDNNRSFDYLRRYVAPKAGTGRANMLAFSLYHVYDAPSPMHSSFYRKRRDFVNILFGRFRERKDESHKKKKDEY
jgi:hypothetical protein